MNESARDEVGRGENGDVEMGVWNTKAGRNFFIPNMIAGIAKMGMTRV